ncbi:hypothetical protein L1285_19215 [Pseudoalteromonas sp. DL2-H2.2]|nr:hypothetical protein [Pseudoalteromonas sp. DL2-H2.2]MCF2910446.1 hypothetical protein [Pseudoalteromonas sp. DL2-H2.2]
MHLKINKKAIKNLSLDEVARVAGANRSQVADVIDDSCQSVCSMSL